MISKKITLTFDNGPVPGVTGRVLCLLEKANIRSTFFVIGHKLGDPGAMAAMRDAHAAGHWIGNHTWSHSVAFGDQRDAAFAVREIEETQSRIGALSHPDKLFRPYGKSGLTGPHLLSRAALGHLLENSYETVLWNNVPGDWKDPAGWADRCVAEVAAQDWSVVVLHDIENGCLERLPDLLQRLAGLGATFEQDFPDSVILTRRGETVSLPPSYIAD